MSLLLINYLLQKVIYQDLINEETLEAVEQIYQSENITSLLRGSPSVELKTPIFQEKMPTLDSNGNLTERRKAPAGHGFIGFHQILETLEGDHQNEISCTSSINSAFTPSIVMGFFFSGFPMP